MYSSNIYNVDHGFDVTQKIEIINNLLNDRNVMAVTGCASTRPRNRVGAVGEKKNIKKRQSTWNQQDERETFSAHKSMSSVRGEAEPDATVGVYYIRTTGTMSVFYFIFSMLPPETQYYNRKKLSIGGFWLFFSGTKVDGS